jgi:proteasome assembly chaperone (PAC2) family protein
LTLGYPLKLYKKPNLHHPLFLLAWSREVGVLGKVIDFVNVSLKTEEIGEIDPCGFFSLSGVNIEEDIIQFPESNFYCSEERNLIVFKSDPPVLEEYRFLNSILDVAKHFKAQEIYTIGGIISPRAHTAPRRIKVVVNKKKLKSMLASYSGLEMNLDYRTPPGERPSLSSFLSWMAKMRDIPTVNLWGEVPFYLASVFDTRAGESVLSFLNQRLSLNMDLAPLREECEEQGRMISNLRLENPKVGKCMEMLERGIMLEPDESEGLRREVMNILSRRWS